VGQGRGTGQKSRRATGAAIVRRQTEAKTVANRIPLILAITSPIEPERPGIATCIASSTSDCIITTTTKRIARWRIGSSTKGISAKLPYTAKCRSLSNFSKFSISVLGGAVFDNRESGKSVMRAATQTVSQQRCNNVRYEQID